MRVMNHDFENGRFAQILENYGIPKRRYYGKKIVKKHYWSREVVLNWIKYIHVNLVTKTSISCEIGNLSQKQYDFGHKNIDFMRILESFSETIRFWSQKHRFRAKLGIFLRNNTILVTKKSISCEFGNLSQKQYDFSHKKVDFVRIWESFSETIRF